MAPMSHTLEAGLEFIFPGSTAWPILQKVACRVAVAPVFLSLSFGALAYLHSEPVVAAVKAKVPGAWRTGSLFWPAVSAVTYRFVPLAARPAVGAAVGSVWSCYLSWVAFVSQKRGIKEFPVESRASR